MNPAKQANNPYMQANIFIHTSLKKSMLKYEIIVVLLVLGSFSQMFIAISTIIIMLVPFIAAIMLLVPANSKEHELRVDKHGVHWGLKSGKTKSIAWEELEAIGLETEYLSSYTTIYLSRKNSSLNTLLDYGLSQRETNDLLLLLKNMQVVEKFATRIELAKHSGNHQPDGATIQPGLQ